MSVSRALQMCGLAKVFVSLYVCVVAGGGASCKDDASCQERLKNVVERLGNTQDSIRSSRQTMQVLETLRSSIMHGQRVHLPSAQRQHLERGSPLIGEVSYDAKHRPQSTNVSQYLRHARTVATGSDIRLHSLVAVKRPAAEGKSGGGSVVLVASLKGEGKLSLHTADGEARLSDYDVGHHVTHWSFSGIPDPAYVFTGDASGQLRATMLELAMKNGSSSESRESGSEDGDEKKRPKKQLVAVAGTTGTFQLPGEQGDNRKITALLVVDRGQQPFFLAADSLGSVAVFFKNGTLKGRVKVTEDAGGVQGLLRGTGQTVLFYSSHSFGFLSLAQVDVMAPPCTGWSSPVFDVAQDPQSSFSRVVLALADGDVLVFSTQSGKAKERTCDLVMKFPRLSILPYRVHNIRGHILALPTPLESVPKAAEYNRELYIFNLAAMEAGYGSGPSKILTLQASFEPRRLDSFDLLSHTGGSASGGASASKVHLTLQFAEQRGSLELYELNLKTAAAPVVPGSASGGGGTDFASWLDWIPKGAIFGLTLVGVVLWNVRKVTNKQKQSTGGGAGGGMGGLSGDDFNAADFGDLREKLKKKKQEKEMGGLGEDLDRAPEKVAKAKSKKGAGAPDLSGLGGLGGAENELADLAAKTKGMEELLKSMNIDG